MANRRFEPPLDLVEQDAPDAPDDGLLSLYAGTDHKLYFKDSAGHEVDLTDVPWLDQLLRDVARCKLALRLLDIDIDGLDVDLTLLIGG